MASTEAVSPRYAGIDQWATEDLVDGMIEGQFAALAAVTTAAGPIVGAIDAATERLRDGGRLVYVGAGTSGRIAAQDAAELPPTFAWPRERAIAVLAGGEAALRQAAEGAEDDGAAARRALTDLQLTAQDVVIALAASGRTPFAVAALEQARAIGALAVGIYNNPGSPLGDVADVAIPLETGAEFIAGSTRMKAATAQKVVLNCISTGIMIRLGFVYRGLMVEMPPTNAKLRERAAGIVAELAGCDRTTAGAALAACGGSIKLATLMLIHDLTPAAAAELLAAHGGSLRAALA